MKYVNFIFVVLLFASCKKDTTIPQRASINIIHATVGIPTLKVNYFGSTIIYAAFTSGPGALAYGTNTVVSVSPGSTPVTIVSSTDTLNPIYNSPVATSGGDVYSLYLAGQSTAAEAVLVKETNIPIHSLTDSTCGIRFINLSYNSAPVNVTLSTTTTVNEFTNVAYKSISDFKSYPAAVVNSTYTFQVRNSTGTLLASYVFTGASTAAVPRFLNVTLAFIGQIGGTGANVPNLVRVNNY